MKRALLLIVPFCLAGCMAHANAEALARENLVQVVQYEGALQGVAESTNTYYKKSLDDLEDDLTAMHRVGAEAERNGLAADAVDAAVRDGFTQTLLRDYVAKSLALRLEQEQRVRASVEKLKAEMADFLNRLDVQQKKLNALKSKLEQLQTERTRNDIIDDLKPILEAVKEAAKSKGESDPPDAEGPPPGEEAPGPVEPPPT